MTASKLQKDETEEIREQQTQNMKDHNSEFAFIKAQHENIRHDRNYQSKFYL